MATHRSVPAWRIPWTEEPGGLQSMGSQRVGHDGATNTVLTFAAEQPMRGNVGCRVQSLGKKVRWEEGGLEQKQLRCWVSEAAAQACRWPVWTRPGDGEEDRGRGQGIPFSCYPFFCVPVHFFLRCLFRNSISHIAPYCGR